MGNPLNSGKTTGASLTSTVSMTETENLLDCKLWVPKNVDGNEYVFNITHQKIEEQKVGERRHPDVKTGFTPTQESKIDWDEQVQDTNTIIPRAFRFTVEDETNRDFKTLIKDVNIDWIAKHIKLSIYETISFTADDILRQFSSSKCGKWLTIVMHDGCGYKIMAYRFKDVAVHTYSTPLDYTSSEALTHKAVLTYRSVERLKRPTK